MNFTFGQRFFIVAWMMSGLLFATAAAAIVAIDGVTYEPGWMVQGQQQHALPGAVVVNEAVMQAYYSGQMTMEEKVAFERDTRSGQVAIPEHHNIGKQARYSINWRTILAVVAAGSILYVFGCLTQFLFLGYGSPVRLMKSRADAT